MEDVLLLVVSIILGVGCALALKHADLIEQAFSRRDESQEFLGPPQWQSLAGRQLATRTAFLAGIIVSVCMFVVSILLLAGVPLYD